MPEIKFFVEPLLHQGYEDFVTFREPAKMDTVTLGDRVFTFKKRDAVFASVLDFRGYTDTFENTEISQEEADELMRQYRIETGQEE